MADFKEAFELVMAHEGGYVDDPDDWGAETYRGISRRYHPGWTGWVGIDQLKKEPGFPGNLKDEMRLNEQVRVFYQAHYWDRFQGNHIPDQDLANKLFDIAVNMGVHRAVLFLQQGLNLLNRNERLYADIVEDGLLGPGTKRAIEGYMIQEGDFEFLLKIINILQGSHYIKTMQKSPVQEKFARGWLKRVAL